MAAPPGTCALCRDDAGAPIWADARLRVVDAGDEAFPAFYRVIWNAHVAELSDLAPDDRAHCLDIVVAVERVLRERLRPTKINLASLGNMVPHLHWHVIARFEWDSHFPQPVWSAAQREVEPPPRQRLARVLAGLDEAVRDALVQRSA